MIRFAVNAMGQALLVFLQMLPGVVSAGFFDSVAESLNNFEKKMNT